jgi:hypothetical protein
MAKMRRMKPSLRLLSLAAILLVDRTVPAQVVPDVRLVPTEALVWRV